MSERRPGHGGGGSGGGEQCVDRGERGVVAFDNSGTVSDVVVEAVGFVDDDELACPVPAVRSDRPTALVNLALDGVSILDDDGAIGAVLDESGTPIRLALSNVETSEADVRRATLADCSTRARPLFDATERLRERVAEEHGHDDPPVGVQLVVELGPGAVHRGFAYTSIPRPDARSAVRTVRERGFDVHLVSGDAAHVLESVAADVGVPARNVHAYLSPIEKAETVSALGAGTDGRVVMIGDYVNDRLAFERADHSILVCADGDPDPDLVRRVDAVAGSLSEVVTRL